MKSLFPCLGIALLVFATHPALAESVSNTAVPASTSAQLPLQVTIIKRDARENVVAVQQVDLAKAIALASQLVPGAMSRNDSDIKSLTITYN